MTPHFASDDDLNLDEERPFKRQRVTKHSYVARHKTISSLSDQAVIDEDFRELTPPENAPQPQSTSELYPLIDIAIESADYSSIPTNIKFTQQDWDIVTNYAQITNLLTEQNKSDYDNPWYQSNAPWTTELPWEIWDLILSSTYFNDETKSYRQVAYGAASVCTVIEKIRRRQPSIKLLLKEDDQLKYYLKDPHYMFLNVHVLCDIRVAQISLLMDLTTNLNELKLARIINLNKEVNNNEWTHHPKNSSI